MKVKTFGFAKALAPVDATLVLDVREVGVPDVDFPAARRLVDRALAHADEVGDEAVIVFGCEYGEERSVALANYVARLLGVTAEHTTKNLPRGTFVAGSTEAKMADFFNR